MTMHEVGSAQAAYPHGIVGGQLLPRRRQLRRPLVIPLLEEAEHHEQRYLVPLLALVHIDVLRPHSIAARLRTADRHSAITCVCIASTCVHLSAAASNITNTPELRLRYLSMVSVVGEEQEGAHT